VVVSSESVSSDASTVVSTVVSNQVRVSSLYVASCEYTAYCDVVSEYIVRE
jgi:hypothetical protein